MRGAIVIAVALLAAACQSAGTPSSPAVTPVPTPTIVPTATPTVVTTPSSPPPADDAHADGFLGQQEETLKEIAFFISLIEKADETNVEDRLQTLSLGVEYRRTTAMALWIHPCLADAMEAWSEALSAMRDATDKAIEATEGGDTSASEVLTETTLPALIPTFQDALDMATASAVRCG